MNWKGGFKNAGHGYFRIYVNPTAPKKYQRYKLFHRYLAEKVLQKSLSNSAVVHHEDNNLVICENASYHKLLHARRIALRDCGHATWRKCSFCHKYDDPKNLYHCKIKDGGSSRHRKCAREYARELYKKTKKRKGGINDGTTTNTNKGCG